MRRSSGPGRRISTSAGASLQQPDEVLAGEAGAAGRGGGDDDAVEALVVEQAPQRVAVAAAALDPGVDRDALARRPAVRSPPASPSPAPPRPGSRSPAAAASGPRPGRPASASRSSARARRRAASSARREISVPVKGRRMLVHACGSLRALAAPARAGDQVAAEEAEQQGDADEEVLDHDSPLLAAPRWATIRTSTPGGVARISRCGSGSRRRARPRGGGDSPTMM